MMAISLVLSSGVSAQSRIILRWTEQNSKYPLGLKITYLFQLFQDVPGVGKPQEHFVTNNHFQCWKYL